MGFAVELIFDAEADTAVRRLWEQLEDRDISNVMPAMGACPHISLALFETVEVDRLSRELRAFAEIEPRIETHFSALGIFPTDEGVVYLAPIVTPELLDMHERLHTRLDAIGMPSIERYRPGVWVPHCTAAIDLPHGSIPRAIETCYHGHAFVPVCLQTIQLVEFRPVVTLCSYALK